ncbi:MAG: hypothetical protein GX802_05580 [Clostridiales bacterium]|nr:hypothetical protein [Clostridiales bacterium]
MLKNSNKTRWLVNCAALCAIAIVLVYLVHVPIIPSAPFLEYDLADVPIFLGTFLYGTPTGLMITFVVCVLQGILFSQQSGIIGIIMHMIATGAFVLVCGGITKHKNTNSTRSLALGLGSATMILLMIPLNLIFTSFFAAKVPLGTAFIETMKAFVTFPSNANAIIVGIVGLVVFAASFLIILKVSKSENILLKNIIASVVSLVFAFLVVLPLNIIFGSIVFPDGMAGIVPLLWTAVVPFNAIKAVANSVITFLVLAALMRTKFVAECA